MMTGEVMGMSTGRGRRAVSRTVVLMALGMLVGVAAAAVILR